MDNLLYLLPPESIEQNVHMDVGCESVSIFALPSGGGSSGSDGGGGGNGSGSSCGSRLLAVAQRLGLRCLEPANAGKTAFLTATSVTVVNQLGA